MRGEFIDLDGARLYYYAAGTRGTGEPVVFLHGFPTSGHLWSDVVTQMPTGHRLVVLDLLGYGRSDPPAGRPLTLRAHADRVVALLDALGIDQACIVGHHLGGGVAQCLALDSPSRVSRLALLSSIAFDRSPSRELRVARALMPITRRFGPQLLLQLLRADLERGYADKTRSAHSIDRYGRPFNSPHGRDVLLQHLGALDARETVALGKRLGDVRVPTAVVWGQGDPFLPIALGSRLAAAIPDATFSVIPLARHFTPEDNPRAVADAVAALLRRDVKP